MEKKSDQMYSKFLQVSRETGLPVKKVLDVFFILSTGEPVNNNQLLQKVGISRNVLNQLKQALSQLLKPPSKDTQIAPDVLSQIKKLYQNGYRSEEQWWSFLENRQYQKVVDLLKSIQDKRPRPKRQYDQFTATLETTARRSSLLHFFEDVREKSLLFLGDDDFTSVATASLGKAKRIFVVDIDDRVLNEIGDVSENRNLEIETARYDARKKLPKDLVGKFDVVFTDPPYTPAGIKLFVSRAVKALDLNNRAARIYVCYGNSDKAKERFLPIYDVFSDSGLMIRWIFDKFNRYHGAYAIGSSSSLFVTEVTPQIKSLIKGDYDKPIYTNN